MADGVVLIGGPQEQKRVAVHPDAALLTAVGDGKTLLTGGDDGRVVAVKADGGVEQIADEKGRWIDAVTLRSKAYAWSAGKQVSVRDEAGAVTTWSAPSTARGLAFQPLRKPWNGKARISTSPFLRMAAFSSLPCRRTHCTAGGFKIRATCA
jgi:hypothetical protein